MKRNIGIIGTGNVGEAVGLAFRKRGHQVYFYDICKEKAECYGYKCMEKLIKESDVIYECIPTESLPDGRCNLTILEQVIGETNQYCKKEQLFVQMSTCVPGTARKMSELLSCRYIVNPSNLRMATRFSDAENPWKVILGVNDDDSADIMKSIYWWIDTKDIFVGTYEFAETVKYTDNCLQVTLIVFWNAIRKFTEEIGCFPELKNIIYAIEKTEALASCGRYPGGAYSGSCFPKDILALNKVCHDMGGNAKLLEMFTETLHKMNGILKKEKVFETPAEELWKVVDGKIVFTNEIE